MKRFQAAVFSDPTTLDLSCRPQSATVLLDMIQVVLQLHSSQCPLPAISPPTVMDTAKVILTRWGVTVPWTWSTWPDGRLYSAEVLEHLVSLGYMLPSHIV